MFRQLLRKVLFLWSWDTRCRNTDVASALGTMPDNDLTILDAGCGENGVANFVSKGKFTGVDLHPPGFRREGLAFVQASILSLPFPQDSFVIATSVDVLEHLSPEARCIAIRELVRVAKKGVLVAFPCGHKARELDERFYGRLTNGAKVIPEWLTEHMKFQYPDIDSVRHTIESEALERGFHIKVRVHYSENLRLTTFLRWIAARSSVLYVGSNFLMGLFQPLLPQGKKGKSYRAILICEFGGRKA